MIHSLNSQNDNDSLTISTVSNQPPKVSILTRIARAFIPCCSSRLVLDSVVGAQVGMEHRANTRHLDSISSITTDWQPDNSIENSLIDWQNSAPDWIEQTQRAAAVRKILHCIDNNETVLNLSCLHLSSLPNDFLKNIPSLQELNCRLNQLTTLDLNGYQNLKVVDCAFNNLTSFNAADAHTLELIDCSYNRLTMMDLNHCHRLTLLQCDRNLLRAININQDAPLQFLSCAANECRNLNLSPFDLLTTLDVRENPLETLVLPNVDPEIPYAMRDLAIRETGIQWDDLPLAIRENQDIFIDMRPDNEEVHQDINNAQNTHIASVHHAASMNASMLKNKNRDANIDQAYTNFSNWINELSIDNATIENGFPNTAFKNKAAQEWIKRPLHINYVDPTSEVSVKEFLSLAWLALNDDTQREISTSVQNAKESLRDALYEIRRGYNLNESLNYPADNEAAASNICAAGTFNKVSEKLVSVIKDVSFKVMTRETFTTSLHAIIRQAVANLLEKNEDPSALKKLLSDNQGLLTESIWDQIKDSVKNAMDQEFESETNIGGLSIESLFIENTRFQGVLEYLKVLAVEPSDHYTENLQPA
jgi:hypothetical protein